MKGYKLFRWTGAIRAMVAANLDKTDQQIADMLCINAYRVQAFRMRQGLVKEDGGRFKSGHEPHNKGKVAPWAKIKCKATQFKKGQRPHTARPPGTIRAEQHKGKWRLMICVEQGRAKPYAKWLWEKERGPVPAGMFVRIINRKWDDVRIDNLQCVTRQENARLNMGNVSGDVRSAWMLKAWKTRRLKEAKRVSEPYKIAA